ncbi:hypothetical protein BO70DRAFT_429030 [Aspergillus heteromorphus CBS 117.55]|uniref:Uncharacterized protein n=1 Tax=Aspergillus heteromorphus CBS 117.55 TaxID=1448321 RepID=A0A317W9X2_9EURO|nr:uncharacterized protein BO70DRAFT_429030 [Aspergillus heteromorphus CBS 117.55]PWY82969.1 hypothetical protein BO70DRAFT_429030 [Aspergillus heteromorphus CBS 117.55]
MGIRDAVDGTEPSSFTMRSPTMAMVTVDRPAAPASAPAPPSSSRPEQPPDLSKKTKAPSDPTPDPNLLNPRLLVNGACVYERHLPGDAYITAHIQRLQHGFYSSPAVSNQDYSHVDFLGITFVLHSANTLAHRFKAATIRASIHGTRDQTSSSSNRTRNPRFLMHAPHLLYGAVSPETLQWNYSLSGSLGVADLPVIASVAPSGGMNGRYKRYEMMRIQGSVRSLKSARGPNFDVEGGEIVWTLEENSLQRSGLPREFTFAVLVAKPRAESRIRLALDIDPVLQCWFTNYPGPLLALPRYKPVRRRPVDFRTEVGQRFEPLTAEKGLFNFAALESSFDDYVYMPGRKFTTGISPDGGPAQDNNNNNNNNTDPEIRRDVTLTRDLTIDPLRGTVRRIPALNAAATPLAGKTAVGGFDPGSFTMRLLVDNPPSPSGKHMQVASEVTTSVRGGGGQQWQPRRDEPTRSREVRRSTTRA